MICNGPKIIGVTVSREIRKKSKYVFKTEVYQSPTPDSNDQSDQSDDSGVDYDVNDYFDAPRYLVTYEFENGESLKMIMFDLQNRQEPGQLFDPGHRCLGPIQITTPEAADRNTFYKWLDLFVTSRKK